MQVTQRDIAEPQQASDCDTSCGATFSSNRVGGRRLTPVFAAPDSDHLPNAYYRVLRFHHALPDPLFPKLLDVDDVFLANRVLPTTASLRAFVRSISKKRRRKLPHVHRYGHGIPLLKPKLYRREAATTLGWIFVQAGIAFFCALNSCFRLTTADSGCK